MSSTLPVDDDGMQHAIVEELTRRAPERTGDDRATERRAAFVAGGVIAAAAAWLGHDDRVPAAERADEVWPIALAAALPLPDPPPT